MAVLLIEKKKKTCLRVDTIGPSFTPSQNVEVRSKLDLHSLLECFSRAPPQSGKFEVTSVNYFPSIHFLKETFIIYCLLTTYFFEGMNAKMKV
jgi:hypothetical protein